MDWTTIAGLIARHMMTTLAGALVTLGLLQASDQNNFVSIASGIVVGALGLAWSWWQKRGQQAMEGEISYLRARLAAKQTSAVIAVALALAGTMLLGGDAHAQSKPRLPLPDPLHLNQSQEKTLPITGTNGGFAAIGGQLQKLTKDIVDHAIDDVTAAQQDATNRNDVIAGPCYDAQLQFMKLLPVEWQTPPTEIGPVLGFQVARDLMNAITGNDKGSLKVACAALVGDQLNILNQLLAMFGIAAMAGLPVGL
jgi:hypothetical protein